MTLAPSSIIRSALIQLNVATDRTFTLPLLIFFPTARCNSRCVSCDWWKADGATDLGLQEIREFVADLPALGVKLVLFSGGEPLLRSEVHDIADIFRAHGIRLHLLTSGLFLERDAEKVGARFENVTISLDAHISQLYQQIRGVNGLELIGRGVRALKTHFPRLPVRARSTLHRHNYRELPHLIDKAKELGLDQVSFLAADVASEAFGRNRNPAMTRGLLLDEDEIDEFRQIVNQTLVSHSREINSGFVAESPEKLLRLPAYYEAQLKGGPFPPINCNAPWFSAVVEADGAVRPCYFHPAVGNIRQKPLRELLDREMRSFRAGLDVSINPTCMKCVCTMKVGLRTPLWN